MLTGRILVVDDDPSSLSALDRLLKTAGFDSVCAADGASALGEVARRLPDVVVTDLRMPSMDGLELTRRMHEIDPDVPVIVTTALEEMHCAIDSLRAGAVDYLLKPLDFEAVLWSVQQAINLHAVKVERHQLRIRATQLYEQAQIAIASYEHVLGVIGHDLRSLLGVIHLSVSRLQGLDGSLPEAARVIPRVVKRMNLLLDNLVEDARLASGNVEIHRAGHSVHRVLADVEDLRPLAIARHVQLDVEYPSDDAPLSCDRQRLGQVLANLVTNAIRFSPSHGVVRVGARVDAEELAFEVEDHGPGIAPDMLPRIFGRFWQARSAGHSGIGLGLFIAHAIAEAHHGRIDVETEVGRGTKFSVVLPREQPASDAEQIGAVDSGPCSGSTSPL
ncbi:MAG: ATP-binding protein [Polyangiales bacterium]